ncbi:MAG: hypothetical protein KAH67_01900 [Flavobacteriaceae bacterium]|nr:hypothetical protein [Flavobacteriaceae bacterium]
MKNLFLILAILASSIAHSQISKEDFETTYPEIKEITVKSSKLEMGYEDQYDSESDPIAYKVNGIYVKYKNEKWFIPYRRISLIDSKEEVTLVIYLKA